MSKNVLIISNSEDIHADLMLSTLYSKGGQAFRIDLDKFPRDYQITQVFLRNSWHSEIIHIPSGKQLDLSQVGAIWLRKPGEFSFRSMDLTIQEQAYARMESEQALFGLLYGLDCYWVSHPKYLRAAMWKGEQLQRATQMGFSIPASIVSNSPEKVREFKENIHGEMIFKAMSSPHLAANEIDEEHCIAEGLATTIVTDDVMETLDSVSELPCHFQQYIPKQYELRITVIGEQLFAAKIHTQDDVRTQVDSRDMSAEILYEATTLPEHIRLACLDFVKSYQLNYSALDMIVTPENEYVFLENNPNGQFLYVEQLVPEFTMIDALATKLLEEARCRSH